MCLREIVFLPELNIGVVKAVFGAEGLCIALGTEKDNLFVERCYTFYLSGSADTGENIERYSEEEFEVYRVIATVKLNRLNIGINPDYLAFSALYVYRSVNKALSRLCQIYSYVFYALFISARIVNLTGLYAGISTVSAVSARIAAAGKHSFCHNDSSQNYIIEILHYIL